MIVIDEPPQADAQAQAEWWASCMGARISSDGRLIVIQSRVSEADEYAPCLESSGEPWPYLVLPP
jgi:hypothetical protein